MFASTQIVPNQPKAISNTNTIPSYNRSSASTYHVECAEKYRIEESHETLAREGYLSIHKIANALQGSIWKTQKNGSGEQIVKIIHKSLYKRHITHINNKTIFVEEDIIKEASILKYLSANDPPESIPKYIDFFQDLDSYFLVMEDGGQNFFEFVQMAHEWMESDSLDTTQWLKFCKNAMKQMTDIVHWLHSMNTAHLDISLENFTISNVKIYINEHSKHEQITAFNTDFKIHIIDFGLSEVFRTNPKSQVTDFRCNKFVGKTRYKSPEVYAAKHVFDARSADCWSLGISFFMMVFGAALYHRPTMAERNFCLVMNGELCSILHEWNKLDDVSSDLLDLLKRILVKERYRLNIEEIKRHYVFLET